MENKENTYVKIYADDVESGALDQIKLIKNSPAIHGLVAIMADVHQGAGCVIGFTGRFNDRIIPNIIGVDIGCLDKDTEFLTKKGWKKISEYNRDDLVLQYNKDTDEASFIEPINYIVKDCDYFYHFKNSKGLDQMVSDEHKMLVFKGYKSKGYKIINMLPKDFLNLKLDSGYYSFKASFEIDNKGIDLTDDEIKLDIMISADGCIKWKRETTHQIYLHLKKERKINRAKELLNVLNIEFKETIGKDKTSHIYFFIDKKFNKDLSKYWNATKNQLKIISEECLLWDGHKGYRSYFSSTNKLNAEIIQFAFSSNNIRAGISISKSDKKNWNDCYVVTPTKNNMVGYNNEIKKIKAIDGKKYCFTVPTGYFVARRNNNIFITGNCGVVAHTLGHEDQIGVLNFEEIDKRIRDSVPLGFNSRHKASKFLSMKDKKVVKELERFFEETKTKYKYSELQLGTLGGGNHFIEIAKSEQTDESYLIVHSGSRNIGLTIANYYQKKAVEFCKAAGISTPKGMEFLPKTFGGDRYLHYMKLAQQYASINRRIMIQHILERVSIKFDDTKLIESIHNFIADDNIVRKGAIQAHKNQDVIIPFNMAEGSILGKGKGIKDYNYSAPHGAGRSGSRSKMKQQLVDGVITMDQFKDTMKDVYSTCVDEKRIDESPFAYKSVDVVMKHIKETVEIEHRLIPVYNLKG